MNAAVTQSISQAQTQQAAEQAAAEAVEAASALAMSPGVGVNTSEAAPDAAAATTDGGGGGGGDGGRMVVDLMDLVETTMLDPEVVLQVLDLEKETTTKVVLFQ
jgi:hypothetical protein